MPTESEIELEVAKSDKDTVDKYIQIENAKNNQKLKVIGLGFAGVVILMFIGLIGYAIVDGKSLEPLGEVGNFINSIAGAVKTLQLL